MAPPVEEAINMHLADEYLFGKNKAFCDQCGRKRVITIETRITHAFETLVVQMQYFDVIANLKLPTNRPRYNLISIGNMTQLTF